MSLSRRVVMVLSLLLCLLLATQAAAADSGNVKRITILLDRTEIGMNADLALFADVMPRSAQNRALSWQAMSARDAFIDIAKSKLGCPYVWGKTGPNAFDCSGFVRWCIEQTGVPFEHINSTGWRTTEQFMRIESMHDILPGDVLVFMGDTTEVSGHVGIFLGGTSMIDASSSKECVRITDDVSAERGYWHSKFIAAYRIFPESGTAAITGTNTLRASAPGVIGIKAAATDGSNAAAYRFLTVLPVSGLGTANRPYQMDTPAALAIVNAYPEACYLLTNDIDLSNSADPFLPIGSEASPFCGLFDGGGYAVSGLRHELTQQTPSCGLFGIIDGGIVQNLFVNGASISQSADCEDGTAGAIAGRITGGGEIRCCGTSGSISASTAGGIVGIVDGGASVLDCYSLASVHAQAAGGVAGNVEGKLRRCYAIGFVKGECAGGVAGTSTGSIKGCYYLNRIRQGVGDGKDPTIALSADAFLLSAAMEELSFDGVWTYKLASAYPYPTLAALQPHDLLLLSDARFERGCGLPFDPYCIRTSAQLAAVAEEPGAYYCLTNDIALTDPFTPIGSTEAPFLGQMDGRGHAITGLNVLQADYAGLFGVTDNAVLSDLTLHNVTVSGTIAGGLAGRMQSTTVTNCYVTGTVSGISVAGGIAGEQADGQLIQSATDASITSDGTNGLAGGLLGSADGNIRLCYAAGSVTGSTAGGLIGSFSGTLQDAFFTGSAQGACAAGIIGQPGRGMLLSTCYSAGQARGTKVSYGVCSNATGSVTRCYFLSDEAEANEEAGTYSTSADMQIEECYSAFDFLYIWTMDGSPAYPYPELIDLPYLPGRISLLQLDGPAEVFLGMPIAYTVSSEPEAATHSMFAFCVENGTGSATVDANGVLTGTAAGDVVLICRATDGGGALTRLPVTVLPARIQSISISGPETLLSGEQASYSAETLPDRADGALLQWKSSDENVLRIDENGRATAISPGTATLSVQLGSIFNTFAVTVHAPMTQLLLNTGSCCLPLGYSFTLQPTLLPEGALEPLHFASSDQSVVTVDRFGVITAAGLGSATVSVTGQSGISASCPVTVVPYMLGTSGDVLTLSVGESAALPVILSVGFGIDTPEIVYASTSEAVRISDDGEVRAMHAGVCLVTAQIMGDPLSTVSVPVLVIP